MPKSRTRRYDQIIFEEPLINISMQPTEEVDPLFIDPTAESHLNNDVEDDVLNGFSIFSPKVNSKKPKQKKNSLMNIDDVLSDRVEIKEEKQDEEIVKIKEEPKDPDEASEGELVEEEIDPVDALAEALNQVEFLCPKCTYRSTDKDEVTQHLVSSHRVCQIGIPRPCDKCDYIAKTVRELANHKKISHPRTTVVSNLPTLPTGEFKCPHCDFTSFHRNNIRSHTKVHTQDTVYTCDKCPYTAISRINIENHAARHLIKSSRKWKFKCKHCGLLERSEKLLQLHLILHGEGEMLKCQLCSYKSPYSHIISMHTRICHGIVGKKSWDREEKWRRRVRKSTRNCTRERRKYTDDKSDDMEDCDPMKEEFLELPPLKSTRGRKKRSCDNDETKESLEETKEELTLDGINTKDSCPNIPIQVEAPRRPTLEERLGRARELINKNLSKKKRKSSPAKEEVKDNSENSKKDHSKTFESGDDGGYPSASDDDNISDDGSDNQSNYDEEETGSKDEEWSEEESEFDPETGDESMQSFQSERGLLNSKDNENSFMDSESIKRADNDNAGEKKSETMPADNENVIKKKKRMFESLDRSDSEHLSSDNESTRSKRFKEHNNLEDYNLQSDDIENTTYDNSNSVNKCTNDKQLDEDTTKESTRAVLVLKRNGSSFTCISKSNSSDSS